MQFPLAISLLSVTHLHLSICTHAEINQMAHYVTLDKVMEEVNASDSDWSYSDYDLVPDDLDGRLDNHSRQEDDKDLLDRIVESREDDISNANESLCEQSPQQAVRQTNFAHDTFLPVLGPRRSILADLNAESQPYDFVCKIWGAETFNILADETNLCAAQKRDRKLGGCQCRGNAVLCWHTTSNGNGATAVDV